MTDLHNVWGKAIEPEKRGRHSTFASAVAASLKKLRTEKSPFFDAVCLNWPRLFPELPARPGSWHDGTVVLYVNKSTTFYLLRPRLAAIKRVLGTLPGAPRTFKLRLEIHSEI